MVHGVAHHVDQRIADAVHDGFVQFRVPRPQSDKIDLFAGFFGQGREPSRAIF